MCFAVFFHLKTPVKYRFCGFHFEIVLTERQLKNVHFVVSQRVHDGKKTVKCIFALSKIKISSINWRKKKRRLTAK